MPSEIVEAIAALLTERSVHYQDHWNVVRTRDSVTFDCYPSAHKMGFSLSITPDCVSILLFPTHAQEQISEDKGESPFSVYDYSDPEFPDNLVRLVDTLVEP